MVILMEEWAQHLCDPKYADTLKQSKKKNTLYPPGFTPSDIVEGKNGEPVNHSRPVVNLDALQVQKAWQIALQPLKSIPMNFFMSYMSGTSLQIIPIVAALMLLSGPIKAIFSVKQAFKPVLGNSNTNSTIWGAMLLYILGQCALMYIGIRKLNQMGLIPNTTSDWLAWEQKVDYNHNIKSVVV
ncbi:similar to Saccharomyces cerevisiae YGL231C EMC4 Member of a transmembrane complex required for efficient folding of proteins in the ER [Maudiozyma barnettii]|uniref:ER membrane protein complex subunit 4 n=1 Tax=Maudiozyma barnettii TaxID=61262 RepID=A0A8H2VB30_9SACH|nr:chaperone EMC4 [Kazachstania barnettii]CAB4251967.1 similar to Saccharomyces cerevisiae YGL231C EMC4 Member of a transmembrane complex required for efficient folding of proteins in the ER [Kazachstania barnettii]CAD1778353.1 similar to Saccharomyces cerevisiae YGL231C EMC4 Member of a transmembrane complex required for efficient folding of proteins in the ER [Kazachstania barnettii]